MRLKFYQHAARDFRTVGEFNNAYCVRRETPKSWVALCDGLPVGFWSARAKTIAVARCQAHEDFLVAKAKYETFCKANP